MKGIEERSGELVVSGSNGAADLEMADHALDAVAFAVDPLVPADDGFPVGFRRDDVANAVGFQLGSNGVASPGVRWKASGMPRASLRQ